MRFGTYYFLQAPPGTADAEVIQREFDQMCLSEELGFDSVWLTEHHFTEYGLSVSPVAISTALAVRTSRIKIGWAAAILPFHDPIRLAEEIALADILSRGRLLVGVGRGNRPGEFAGFRVPQEESRERFHETLELMLAAWTQERVSYHGKFFQVGELAVRPKPLTRPHPPIFLVATSPETVSFAARRGWPILNSVITGPLSQVIAHRDLYLATRREMGASEEQARQMLDGWGVSRHIYVAPTDAQAMREARAAEEWYQGAFKRFLIPERIEDAPPSLQPRFRAMAARFEHFRLDDVLRESVLFGSPERVIDGLEEMRALGIGEVLCWMNFGGLAPELVARSMRLFADRVIPRFR